MGAKKGPKGSPQKKGQEGPLAPQKKRGQRPPPKKRGYIDDLSENETALLGAAIARSAAGAHDEACSPALAAFDSLWRRVRERR
jgi:hypothetical protein